MIEELFENNKRTQRVQYIDTHLLVAGGGMAGVCAAIAAARQGLRVALVQDRPVLGGNASSEVRLWVLGATSHMGNNNRWAREGGLLNELLVENTYRNKEGNPVIFDTVLLDKVLAENNISLFLNTVVYDIEKNGSRNIASVTAYNSQNETCFVTQRAMDCWPTWQEHTIDKGRKTPKSLAKSSHPTKKHTAKSWATPSSSTSKMQESPCNTCLHILHLASTRWKVALTRYTTQSISLPKKQAANTGGLNTEAD